MSNEKDYYFIPDYFIVDGKKIGKQDPGYDDLVAKYCKRNEVETSITETKGKETVKHES